MSTLSTNPRIQGLVEAWLDLEVRAKEEEERNWLHLSRVRVRTREGVSGKHRILDLVEAWQARAREEEVKNWSTLSRARVRAREGLSASPRDSREISNPSTIPR